MVHAEVAYSTPSTTIGVPSMLSIEVVVPREAELLHVVLIDLFERAVALLVVGATDAHPVTGFPIGLDDALSVDIRRTVRRGRVFP
jgi:hypothetical protein